MTTTKGKEEKEERRRKKTLLSLVRLVVPADTFSSHAQACLFFARTKKRDKKKRPEHATDNRNTTDNRDTDAVVRAVAQGGACQAAGAAPRPVLERLGDSVATQHVVR